MSLLMAEEEKSLAEGESKEDSPAAETPCADDAVQEEKCTDRDGPESNKINLPIQEIMLAPEDYVPTQEQEAMYVL